MSRIVIFAGTTEGRKLAECLVRSGIECDVCVATEYGNQVLTPSKYIHVHQGRLDAAGMRALYQETGCEIVVDATHPYAKIVTETIKESVEGSTLTLIRLLRPEGEATEGTVYESTAACAKALQQTAGRILLTTGSKELQVFCETEGLRERLVVRVLPGMESLKLCYDAGLQGRQIICMQGPFSVEMNESTLRQYEIQHLVTKESGSTGGVDTKILAAEACKVAVHVIRRPVAEKEAATEQGLRGYSMEETCEWLKKRLGVTLNRGTVSVNLVGIGCGNSNQLTGEARQAIEASDYLFGAPRMLENVPGKGVKKPYYLTADILPELERLKTELYTDCTVSVLFSGDSGFYSGAEKLYEALSKDAEWEVTVYPGISSVSMLAAKIGISWQDAEIVSLHGVDKSKWMPRFLEAVRNNRKTFFITSGVEDVRRVGELLEESTHIQIYLGYQLSYETEKVYRLRASECKNLTEEGLYAGVVVHENCEKKILVPSMRDEDFLRDKVPMTKEEIRKLSLCKLQIAEGDVVYDIGSGTGSIAIQAAALSAGVSVYALECKHEAVELIQKNKEKHKAYNLTVLETTAPAGLEKLPRANCAFIGGSRGNLKEILHTLQQINPAMRVVMNAVSMESICEMNECLRKMSVQNVEISQVAVNRVQTLGEYHMLQANNPVFIYAFQFCEE